MQHNSKVQAYSLLSPVELYDLLFRLSFMITSQQRDPPTVGPCSIIRVRFFVHKRPITFSYSRPHRICSITGSELTSLSGNAPLQSKSRRQRVLCRRHLGRPLQKSKYFSRGEPVTLRVPTKFGNRYNTVSGDGGVVISVPYWKLSSSTLERRGKTKENSCAGLL